MYFYRGNPYYPNYYQKAVRNDYYTLKVLGEGTISVQPDSSDIIIGVSTENQELRRAQTENAEKIKNVQEALKSIGILQEQMRTTEYSIYPQYDYVDGKQIFRGYKVDHHLNITVMDLSKVGLVVDTAVANGANTIRNIVFSIADQSASYQNALTLSIQDAITKANTIANGLKVQLIKTPISITEISNIQTSPPIPFQAYSVKAAATTPIEPGKLEVRASILAVFQYYQ